MIDGYIGDVMKRFDAALATAKAPAQRPTCGQDAARLARDLMLLARKTIDPEKILDAYRPVHAKDAGAKGKALWGKFGAKTITLLAAAARHLAFLVESAWLQGKGQEWAIGSAEVDTEAIAKFYLDKKTFVPSSYLGSIPVLTAASGPPKP